MGDLRLASWLAPYAPANAVLAQAAELSPAYALADTATRVVSPYASGPFYANPLEKIVSRFAFDRVCADRAIKHKLTRPYRPQTNGKVERFNRRLGEALDNAPADGGNLGKNRFRSHAERNGA